MASGFLINSLALFQIPSTHVNGTFKFVAAASTSTYNCLPLSAVAPNLDTSAEAASYFLCCFVSDSTNEFTFDRCLARCCAFILNHLSSSTCRKEY